MSPAAGDLLVEHIAPRLRSAIPRVVQPVGAEDAEELVQDAIAMAAKLLHNVEAAGKTVTPGNIAYYCILHAKSGRRSGYAGRADALAVGTQLDSKSSVMSMEDEVGYDPELDEAVTLGDILASNREDPSMAAARNIDWELFIETHDYRYGVIIQGFINGQPFALVAEDCGADYTKLRELRGRLADDLKIFMGEEAVADSMQIPAWRFNLLVDRERVACRANRRRW
jgi:hypothetical protein